MEENPNLSVEEELEDERAETRGGESRTAQQDDLLLEKLAQIFSQLATGEKINHRLAKLACEHNPIDLAYAAERLPYAQRSIIFHNLQGPEERSIFLMNVETATRRCIFIELSDQEIAELVELTPTDEALWVVEDLSPPRFIKVLALLPEAKADAIRDLQQYEPNTAGRLMSNEFFAFSMETTLGEAAVYIRDHPGIDLLRRIFVYDEDRELQGFVPLRNLVINRPSLPLKQVMRPLHHMVHPEADRDEVVEIFERYRSAELPVVDGKNRLLGVISYEDVVEILEDIADETIAHISGTGHEVSTFDPLWKNMVSRAPWLLVTLAAGIVNANNISSFDISHHIINFVPLVNGMSGNIGLQCSTVLVRGMATGVISSSSLLRAVFKELSTGVLTGASFGIFGGLFIYFLQTVGLYHSELLPSQLAMIVTSGLTGSCVIASFLGVVSPVWFDRIGIDPAIASGPIVTAVNDVLSTLMYFVIAKLMMTLIL